MTDIPVSPPMTHAPIPYTRAQLTEQHFDACCAFQQDSCHWADEYNDLYGRLEMAGLPAVITPANRAKFETWLATYAEPTP